MMLDLIERLRGAELAGEVANALVHTPRETTHTQRIDDDPIETPKKSLARRLVGLMESNLDFPLAPREIAGQMGVSIRTLERHCFQHFKQTPARLYLRIRLQAARNLLFYQDTEIKDIALACGFSYPSVFSRAFATQFGYSPRAFRETLRVSQGQTVRPEIVRLSRSKGPRDV
jgi:AraC family carnitine catabolism transcriptional activator